MSNENNASSGALVVDNTKTPTNVDRANHTMQNFFRNNQDQRNSIKCLEVLSKQVAQNCANKSRKGEF